VKEREMRDRENVRYLERKANVVDDGAGTSRLSGIPRWRRRTCRCSWNLMGSSCVIFTEVLEGSVVTRLPAAVPAAYGINTRAHG